MDKDTRGIGDNSTQETNYKTLFESLISMVLEPKINIDTFLKDQIETARTATRLADKFEALHLAEEIRDTYEDRLNTLEHFKQCASHALKPHNYMWKKLQQQWGSELYEYYCKKLSSNTQEFGTSWKNEDNNAN